MRRSDRRAVHPMMFGRRARSRRLALALGALIGALLATSLASPAQAARLKDVAHVDGVRPNQLVGYGLVVGLDGTGDSQRVPFTPQAVTAMLSRVGVRVDATRMILRNVAAVTVTATLPPFVEHGTPVDVVVSAMGDARSLVGGTLIMTPLLGVDGQTYAIAQGPVQVGGFQAGGRSGTLVRQNHLNVGRVPGGALVERTVPVTLGDGDAVRVVLHRPDFATAQSVAAAVAAVLGPDAGAKAVSAGAVTVPVPAALRDQLPALIAQLEALEVTPDTSAKVVVNGRTGTIVLGRDVRIAPVAIAHGSLTLEVQERPIVAQPNPLAAGDTAVVADSAVSARETPGALKLVKPGADLAEVVDALNALGATPRDLVQILQAIQAAGALHGTLEVL